MTFWHEVVRLLARRPESRCSVCGAKPVVMSGTARDVYGQQMFLGACGEHNRRLDYALYLVGTGEDGDTLCRWLNERIDEGRGQ
jgi:hypothetical protein